MYPLLNIYTRNKAPPSQHTLTLTQSLSQLNLHSTKTITSQQPTTSLRHINSMNQMWHNSRSCADAPRFSLCGSTQHTKENHGSLCVATGDHVWLLRCIHCKGPYPTDSLNYTLRLDHSSTSNSKSQVSATRKICADAWFCAQAEAGCVKGPAKDISSASSNNNNNSSTLSLAQAPTIREYI